jgi:hypothetical protein
MERSDIASGRGGGFFDVDSLIAVRVQPSRKRRRELSVNEELHSAAVTMGWFISLAA